MDVSAQGEGKQMESPMDFSKTCKAKWRVPWTSRRKRGKITQSPLDVWTTSYTKIPLDRSLVRELSASAPDMDAQNDLNHETIVDLIGRDQNVRSLGRKRRVKQSPMDVWKTSESHGRLMTEKTRTFGPLDANEGCKQRGQAQASSSRLDKERPVIARSRGQTPAIQSQHHKVTVPP